MPTPVFQVRRGAGLLASSLIGLALACGVILLAQGPSVVQAEPIPAPAALTYPGSGNCSTTLQHCINTAAAGETINILSGTYVTSVTMNKAVSLVGAGVGATVIQALPGQRVLNVNVAMTGSTQIAGMTLKNGQAAGSGGGGIFLTVSAQPLLQNLLVFNNSADTGGGIFASSPITLSNVTVRGNTATNGSGGGMVGSDVFAADSVFRNNTIITGGSGAGLATFDAFHGTNVSFLTNTVNGLGDGGGLFAAGSLALNGGQFVNNRTVFVKASGGGGGLVSSGSTSISGTQFINNSGDWGGGAYIYNPPPSWQNLLTNVTFIKNTAYAGGGGGLFTWFTATLTAVDFYTNSASNFGGGAYAGFGDYPIVLQGVTMVSNTAQSGGGLYSIGHCMLVGGRFERNSALPIGWGGGAMCIGPSLSISGTQFLTNSAVGAGVGGGALGNTVWVTNTVFAGNTTGGYAGALQTYGPTHILHSLFQSNASQGNGGAISAVSAVWISDTDFISNTTQGDGTLGGGAVTSNQSIAAINSRFTGNTANTSPGGALIALQSLYLDHSAFTANAATTGDGGAAFAFGGATLDHVTFSGNHSGLNGGALAVTGTLTVSNTLVTGNSADRGGGLYQYAGAGRLLNSLFAGNSAVSTAGMQLYLAPTGTLQIMFSTVGAPSFELGDAIRIAGGNVQLYDTIVTSHAVGLRRLGGLVTQDYNLFFGDSTDILGGATGGTHNASGDPRFADPAAGNFHLRAGSPAINAGVDLGVNFDIDDQARPVGARFDIGYDEFSLLKLLLPLVMK